VPNRKKSLRKLFQQAAATAGKAKDAKTSKSQRTFRSKEFEDVVF